MVNAKYSKTLNDLKGVAKVIARQNMFKGSPPFYQFQIKHDVKESERIDQLPFVVGDRVQMIRGPEKNKIGIIRSVYKNGNAYMVEGVGGTEKIVLPKELWSQGQSKAVVSLP
jgi:large subunit ribosomal protein L24